jgi:hypothetical protein
MVSLECCSGDYKMINETYPDREAIRRHEFAVRHLILAEIKYLKESEKLRPDNEENQLLSFIAEHLIVEKKGNIFDFWIGNKIILSLPENTWVFYYHADSIPELIADKNEDTDDQIWIHNRREAFRVIDFILNFSRKGV